MALPATLYDFEIALHHIDRGLDAPLRIKVPRHPSEALPRLWLRVLAYCWQYDEQLSFGPGLSDPDAPDLVSYDLTGEITLWLRVGKVDPAKLTREVASHPRAKVCLLFESGRRLNRFMEEISPAQQERLRGVELAAVDDQMLATLARDDVPSGSVRRHRLDLTWVGDHLYIDRGGQALDGALVRGHVSPSKSQGDLG